MLANCFFSYFYLRVFTYKYSILFYILGCIFKFSGYQFHLITLCSVLLCIYQNKIVIFAIPIAYWSGFEIFKQNRENPDEIGMVGQCVNSHD